VLEILNEVNEKILGVKPLDENSIEPNSKVFQPVKIWDLKNG
jgi:hypothetical protein